MAADYIPTFASTFRKKKDLADKESPDSDESRDATVLDKETQAAAVTQQEGAAAATVILDLSKLRAYLRELDMDVFELLGVGLITKAALDTDLNTKVKVKTMAD